MIKLRPKKSEVAKRRMKNNIYIYMYNTWFRLLFFFFFQNASYTLHN